MVVESIEFNPFRVIWIANMNVKAVTQIDLDENSPGGKKYPPFASFLFSPLFPDSELSPSPSPKKSLTGTHLMLLAFCFLVFSLFSFCHQQF